MFEFRTQVIASVDVSRELVLRETPFKLRKAPRRMAWLARACWWLLHRLNALEAYMHRETVWHFDKTRNDDLIDAICRKIPQIWRIHEEPGRWVLLVGQEEFRQIVASPTLGREVHLVAGPIRYGTYGRLGSFGLHFYVIPHISGWGLVPRVAIESSKVSP